MKVVLDTNVLISGLAYPHANPGRIVGAWREGRFDLVISKQQLSEIGRVLAYPKIRERLGLGDATIAAFLKQLLLRSELVDIEGVAGEVPQDPDDRPILAALLVAEADWLVTGDRDLLVLRDQHSILAPADFAKTL